MVNICLASAITGSCAKGWRCRVTPHTCLELCFLEWERKEFHWEPLPTHSLIHLCRSPYQDTHRSAPTVCLGKQAGCCSTRRSVQEGAASGRTRVYIHTIPISCPFPSRRHLAPTPSRAAVLASLSHLLQAALAVSFNRISLIQKC